MSIRAATHEDLAAVLALVPRLSATGVPPGRDAAQIEASDTQSIARALTQTSAGEALLIATEGGELLGLVHIKTVVDYFSQQPIAHVSDVVVAASAEGRGVGKALMHAAEDWAREQSYPMIQLHVLVENDRARSMYERLGYSAEWLKYVKRLD